jgi:hypothetical protein
VQGASWRAKAAQYTAEKAPLMREARRNEAARDQDLKESTLTEQRKVRFDIAVALFEISIVLVSIAALARRPWLLAFVAVGGVTGLVYVIRGLLP